MNDGERGFILLPGDSEMPEDAHEHQGEIIDDMLSLPTTPFTPPPTDTPPAPPPVPESNHGEKRKRAEDDGRGYVPPLGAGIKPNETVMKYFLKNCKKTISEEIRQVLIAIQLELSAFPFIQESLPEGWEDYNYEQLVALLQGIKVVIMAKNVTGISEGAIVEGLSTIETALFKWELVNLHEPYSLVQSLSNDRDFVTATRQWVLANVSLTAMAPHVQAGFILMMTMKKVLDANTQVAKQAKQQKQRDQEMERKEIELMMLRDTVADLQQQLSSRT